MKEYNYDNINEFYEELNEGLNPNMKKLLVWAGWARDQERREEEQKITKLYSHNGFPGRCYEAEVIENDIAIVGELYGNKTEGFYATVNHKRSNVQYSTFDEALLAAICIKYTGNDNALMYVKKILDM